MSARERIEFLLDEGTFEETDKLVTHRCTDFGMDEQKFYGDGFVTGYGRIEGRLVFVFAQDFTVFGGSLSEANAAKIVQDHGPGRHKVGAPVIGLNDSGGARIQEGVMSLAGYADIFLRNTLASGVVPQISAIMGPCAGGAVYSPAITDFILMVDKTSYMFITGPDVIKTVTHEEVTKDELGGAETHNETSGVAHFMAHDDAECLIDGARAAQLHAVEQSRRSAAQPCTDPIDRADAALDTIVPDRVEQALRHQRRDPRRGRRRLLLRSAGALRQEHRRRLRAPERQAGRHRRQPAGVPGRRARHQRIDQRRALRALLRLLQHPAGHLRRRARIPARHQQEYGGIIKHGAKLLFAFAEATVPKVTVITRKAYGGAYCVMASKHIRTDVNYAWPTAEIAVMGPEGAVDIVYKRELEKAENREAELRQEKIEEFRERFANPYVAAERGFVDAVIQPRDTRKKLIQALEMLETKRDKNPPKKHGNIPL